MIGWAWVILLRDTHVQYTKTSVDKVYHNNKDLYKAHWAYGSAKTQQISNGCNGLRNVVCIFY